VVFDPEAESAVDPARIHHKHKLTPYAGLRLFGAVRQTYLRGELVYDAGRFAAEPRGRRLSRGM